MFLMILQAFLTYKFYFVKVLINWETFIDRKTIFLQKFSDFICNIIQITL